MMGSGTRVRVCVKCAEGEGEVTARIEGEVMTKGEGKVRVRGMVK